MLFLSSDTIKKAEARTMEKISSLSLIENAAYALVRELEGFSCVRIYCGKGNNGSDGYAAAILLHKKGIYVEIVQVLPPASEECIFLARKAAEENIPIHPAVDYPLRKFDAVVDAIFGIGIKGEIENPDIIKAIDIINTCGSFVLCADIPSGMDADTGTSGATCVRADKTVTFTAPKRGMLSPESVDICGEIKIAEVGIEIDYSTLDEGSCVPLTGKFIKNLLPPRKRYSHKGTFGNAVIVAGSHGMPGACAMAAMAAMRSGCGLVRIIAPVSICPILNILVKEAIVIPVPEENGVILPSLSPQALSAIAKADSILVGCGLGKGSHDVLISNILTTASCSVIIDADGINALSGKLDIIKNKNVLLTPHVLEFSRISGLSVAEIEKKRIQTAQNFSRENGITLLLKGARTVIAYGGKNKYVSLDATSALAKAGSGDVLAGIIVSLAAQGTALTDSAAAGCYIHCRAGMIAEKTIGAYSATSDDIINLIGAGIKEIISEV